MNLQININYLTIMTFMFIFNFSSIGACQEKETKMTLQEMLFQGVKEQDQKKGCELVQQAIDQGVDINIKDNNGNTALILAARNRNNEIVQLLLNAKANPDIQNNFGNTALFFAARSGNKEIVQLLLNANANLDVQNQEGNTALIVAARYGNKEIVQLLLNANVDIDIKNEKNNTALDIAQERNFPEIAEMLQNEPIKRKALKELVKKEASGYLPDVLANLVSEYVVLCPKQINKEN